MLSFTVIGGGATGVEMAGALGEMRRYILPREYSSIPQKDVCITLVEGTGALLGAMSEKAHEKSMQYLEELGVNVVLKHFLKNYEGMDATLDDGSVILSGMLIWTAGITAQKYVSTDLLHNWQKETVWRWMNAIVLSAVRIFMLWAI